VGNAALDWSRGVHEQGGGRISRGALVLGFQPLRPTLISLVEDKQYAVDHTRLHVADSPLVGLRSENDGADRSLTCARLRGVKK
jgi:hypothetical protein